MEAVVSDELSKVRAIIDRRIAEHFEMLQERCKLTGALSESLNDSVSKIAGRPAATTQMPEHHSMKTPQAQRRPNQHDGQAGHQPQYQQPVRLVAAPYVRRFGEDINKCAARQTEQPQAQASYPNNVAQQCRYPPMPKAFNQQHQDGVVDHAGLLAASPPVETQGRCNPNAGVG